MTLSLYIQIVAARAHIERLREENPPRPLSQSVRAALQALREAGRPMNTKQVCEEIGRSDRVTATALYELKDRGMVELEQRFVLGHLTNFWTLVDDVE